LIEGEKRLINFSEKAVSGVAWMFTSTTARNGVAYIVNIILARVLVPSDFGAVALVVGVIAILQTFAEMGTSVALVQRQNVTPSVIDSAFISTFTVTILIVLLLWSFSNNIAAFFSVPVLAALLKIAAFSYLFRGVFSLYRCLLLKEMRYKEISLLEFINVIIYGLIAVVLAFSGYGPFSIVWGQVFSAIFLLILGFWRTGYIPKSFGRIKEIWELLSFGIWVSIGRILGNSSGKIDTFIIGKLLNASTLGSYYLAQRIVMLLPGTYTQIIDQVTLPIYSKFQKDPSRVEEGYWKTISFTSLIILPLVCLLFIFADPLVRWILGEKWIQVIPLVRIMSLFVLAHALGGGIFASVIYALGRPQIATIVNIFRIIALPTCVIIGSRWGVMGVAWGFAAYGIIGRLFNQWLLKRNFSFSLIRYFREIAPALISGLLATGVALGIFSVFGKDTIVIEIIKVITGFIVWCITYYVFVKIFAPEKSKYALYIIFQFIKKFRRLNLLRNITAS